MAWKVIDISKYQGDVDFAKVKASGVDGVILRTGIGSYSTGALQEDSKFVQNINGFNSVGMPVGMYYFSQATTEAEAVNEANFLIERAKKYNTKLPLVFDLENEGRIASLTKAKITKLAIAFCDRVKEAGYIPVVYTYKSFFDSRINESEIKAAGYDRWIAHYTSTSHPEYETEYVMWQYSSTGSVPGISGNVDMNYCYKDYFSGGGSKVKFTSRLTAPSTTDKNWIKTTHGGYNHALLINSSTGSVLPNCTGYVHGRWCELGLPESKLCLNDAEWYYQFTSDGFARGQVPKLGAIACWRKGNLGSSDGAGHVAIVEGYTSNTSVTMSHSAYGGTRFYTNTVNPNTYPGGTYVFLGYIYSPIDFENGGTTGGIGVTVERDKFKNQIEVIETNLRARSTPTTSSTTNILGIVNVGIFNVIKTESADGFIWANIGEGIWIATKEGEWTKSYTAIPLTPARLKMGPASSGDKKRIETMLKEMLITYKIVNDCVITDVVVSSGDKKRLVLLCEDMQIPCVDYTGDDTDPNTIEQLEAQIRELEKQVTSQQTQITTLSQENASLQGNLTKVELQNSEYDAAMQSIKSIVVKF